jgi:hypothetical protein
MSKGNWFFSLLIVVSFILCASLASADIAAEICCIPYTSVVECDHSFLYTGFHITNNLNSGQGSPGGGMGGFYVTGIGSSGFNEIGGNPSDYSVAFHFRGLLGFGLWFPGYEFESDVPFGSVTCTAQVLVGGVETTIGSLTVDRAMLLSTVGADNPGQNIFWGGGGWCDLGTILESVTWLGGDDGAWWENCEFTHSWPISFTITNEVPAAPVPLPSALVLLGSGLIRLAISGRRKLVCRS